MWLGRKVGPKRLTPTGPAINEPWLADPPLAFVRRAMMCRHEENEGVGQAVAMLLLLLLTVAIWVWGCTLHVHFGGSYYGDDYQATQPPAVEFEIPSD